DDRRIDTESYEKYLRARALVRARGGVTAVQQIREATEAVSLLEGTLAKNPVYAPAWMMLTSAYVIQANNEATFGDVADARRRVNQLTRKAQAASQKALQLDPTPRATNYSGMAWVLRTQGHPLEAEEYRERSLALDPVDSSVLFISGMLTGSDGRLK